MIHPRPTQRAAFFLLLPLACCLAFGCGGNGTHRVSGKVTFKGQPVPAGKIYFVPDTKKGGAGPTGYADIKDGAYDTSARGGMGSIGGPMLIKIEGYDPAQLKPENVGKGTAKPLFPLYQTQAELPKEDTTKDFDVSGTPSQGASGGGGPK